MPRTARLILPHFPHHVLHRSRHREAVFLGEDDYRFYVDSIWKGREIFGVKIYAYCLMLNHVHLIVNPGNDARNLSRFMKHLAGRQSGYMRRSSRYDGALWEGRYRSSPIASHEFLLACGRYIELNPMRACLVAQPDAYAWSSYRAKVGLSSDLIDLDPTYINLGQTPQDRAQQYQRYLQEPIPYEEWKTIREAIQSGNLTGDDASDHLSSTTKANHWSLAQKTLMQNPIVITEGQI